MTTAPETTLAQIIHLVNLGHDVTLTDDTLEGDASIYGAYVDLADSPITAVAQGPTIQEAVQALYDQFG